MKKLMMIALLLAGVNASAQKLITRTGKVTFFSSTKIENIEAINNETACVLDTKTGDVAVKIPIKSFKFEQALMEEHFNENYLESGKYPIADFKGKITNNSDVNYAKDGTYKISATGKITMHGVTRDAVVPGTLTVKGGNVTANAKFNLQAADYKVKIPSLVADKISKNIEVTLNSKLSPLTR